MKKKFIITGPPGSGKSTLIEALEKQGFDCMKEVARDVIISEQKSNQNGTPWENMERFAQLVYNETLDRYLADDNSLFCDRSLIDNIAYLEHENLDVFKELEEFQFTDYYHTTVFYTPPWEEIYQQDPQRPQLFEEQLPLNEKLVEVYKRLGFKIVQLPLSNIETRVNFILDVIARHEAIA